MQQSAVRSAALLISVYVDPDSATGWYAHIYSYGNAFQQGTERKHAITVSEVCQVMRHWIKSVIAPQ